jgi:hypothetical protein
MDTFDRVLRHQRDHALLGDEVIRPVDGDGLRCGVGQGLDVLLRFGLDLGRVGGGCIGGVLRSRAIGLREPGDIGRCFAI